MAKAINLRTRLSLPPPFRTRNGTVEDLASHVDLTSRNLHRWATALPFGMFGFTARRTNDDAAITTGSTGILSWDQVDVDQEGWWVGGDQDRFYCPPGGSGWFLVHLNVYIDADRSNWYPGVRRIDVAGTVIPEWQSRVVSNDRFMFSGLMMLEDGEGFEAYIYNNSGATITPTYAARDTTVTPYLPQLRVIRLALL